MARFRFLVLENNRVHLFHFWVLSPSLIAAGCCPHEMLSEVKTDVLVGREHHLLEVARHQRDRVKQVIVAVDAAHRLGLLQLHRNCHLLVQEGLVRSVWTKIPALRSVDLHAPLFVRQGLPLVLSVLRRVVVLVCILA